MGIDSGIGLCTQMNIIRYMKQADRYTRLKRKNEESGSQSFGTARYASYIQEQVNTQDALGSTLTTQESTVSMRYHERKQNARTADQGRLSSPHKIPAPRNPTITKPGTFSLIGNESVVVVVHTLTTTAAADCLITVSPRELVVFPLPDAGTSLDIDLDARHIVILEDGRGARFDHCHCWRWLQDAGASVASRAL